MKKLVTLLLILGTTAVLASENSCLIRTKSQNSSFLPTIGWSSWWDVDVNNIDECILEAQDLIEDQQQKNSSKMVVTKSYFKWINNGYQVKGSVTRK